VHGPVKVRKHFDMNGHHGGARIGECVDVAVGLLDHEMDVQRYGRHALQRADDGNPDGDIRDEVPVHDVNVNQVGASPFDSPHRVAKGGEVGGENRRGDADRHRLTSIEMASPGAI
jgi:hypothetical protein